MLFFSPQSSANFGQGQANIQTGLNMGIADPMVITPIHNTGVKSQPIKKEESHPSYPHPFHIYIIF
jgi:hypothetical protein